MLRLLPLALVLALGACTKTHDLVYPTGAVFPLNVGHWQWMAADLAPPSEVRP